MTIQITITALVLLLVGFGEISVQGCADNRGDCDPSWCASEGWEYWLQVNCPWTCGFCGCTDDTDCDRTWCTVSEYAYYVSNYCRNTCRTACLYKGYGALTASPVDCVYEWQPWTQCSASCGDGDQSRNIIITTEPANGGQACPQSEYRRCNYGNCPSATECVWDWEPWTQCSASCGDGWQSRTMVITSVPSGGQDCPKSTEHRQCNDGPCQVQYSEHSVTDCMFQWQPWSACSHTCGLGERSRKVLVEVDPSNGGQACPQSPEYSPCADSACPDGRSLSNCETEQLETLQVMVETNDYQLPLMECQDNGDYTRKQTLCSGDDCDYVCVDPKTGNTIRYLESSWDEC